MLTIRLRRMGAKHRPFYRVVVSDSRRTPKGAFVESLGHFDPTRTPPACSLDMDRLNHWIGLGAQPSDRVRQLMNAEVRRKERGEDVPLPTEQEAAAEAAAEPSGEEQPPGEKPAGEETGAGEGAES